MQTLCRGIIYIGIHREGIGGPSPNRNTKVVAAGKKEILMILQSSAGGSFLSIFRGSNPITWQKICAIVFVNQFSSFSTQDVTKN